MSMNQRIEFDLNGYEIILQVNPDSYREGVYLDVRYPCGEFAHSYYFDEEEASECCSDILKLCASKQALHDACTSEYCNASNI